LNRSIPIARYLMITNNFSAKVRPATVAGMFYPGNENDLRNTVQKYLQSAGEGEREFKIAIDEISAIRMFIVPHAGYIYSGKTAAFAYQLLNKFKNKIRRVLMLGPAHRVFLTGAALPESDSFETPLGQIKLDKELMEKILEDYSWITVNDQAHAEEHCLEVQLPFLQETINDFKIVPLVVGDIESELLAQMILKYSEDDHTLILISTDLSHYHDYKTSCELDLHTARAIESLSPELLSPEDACGIYPLRGALLAASKRTWHVHRLHLCNSGDTAGDCTRVVGYGAWMVNS